jgi:hypothetical protein
MARYENNMKGNILQMLLSSGLKPDFDGKFRLNPVPNDQSPWIHQNGGEDERNCTLWLNYFFKYAQILPWQCTGCWKIFANPQTLEQVFMVREMQKDRELNLGLDCKCGLEQRYFTGNVGGWAAFWYNPLFCGLNVARNNLARLEKNYPELKLQLKRGCTELEDFTKRKFGMGSDSWNELITPFSLKVQKALEGTMVHEVNWSPMPRALEKVIENRWIEHAIQHCKLTGDMTWKRYIDEEPIVTYELYGHSIHRANDYAGAKNGRNYLINLVGRCEASKHFGDEDTGDGLLVPELEKKE